MRSVLVKQAVLFSMSFYSNFNNCFFYKYSRRPALHNFNLNNNNVKHYNELQIFKFYVLVKMSLTDHILTHTYLHSMKQITNKSKIKEIHM